MGNMSEDTQYKTLMKYLKLLHKENATVTTWLPEYHKSGGKITITIEIKEK